MGWIDVKQKLPPNYEQVLVYLKPVPKGPEWYPRTNCVLAWTKRGIWFGAFANFTSDTLQSGEMPEDLVTHWMPLPDAPPISKE